MNCCTVDRYFYSCDVTWIITRSSLCRIPCSLFSWLHKVNKERHLQKKVSHDVVVVSSPVIWQITSSYHNDRVVSVAVVTYKTVSLFTLLPWLFIGFFWYWAPRYLADRWVPVSEVSSRQHLHSASGRKTNIPQFRRSKYGTCGLSQSPVRRFGTRCLIRRVIRPSSLNVLGGTWKHTSLLDIRGMSTLNSEVTPFHGIALNKSIFTYFTTTTFQQNTSFSFVEPLSPHYLSQSDFCV